MHTRPLREDEDESNNDRCENANYLYLLAQFLNRTTSRHTNEYGGEIENRARILFEVIEAVLDELRPKVGDGMKG